MIEQNKKSVFYYKFRPRNEKYAIVVGPEVRGLSQAVLKKADKILEIPMAGMKVSLNIAIAFSVVASELKCGRK